MKILFAVHGYPPESSGGTELYVRKLAGSLAERGHAVSVVAGSTRWRKAAAAVTADAGGIPVTTIHRSDPFHEQWQRSFCPTASALFDEALKAAKPDLVHVHHWMRLSRDLVEVARRRGIPAVVTLHDLWTTCLRLDRVLDGEEFCTRKLEPGVCVACVGGARPWTGPHELEKVAALFRADARNELTVARRRIVPTRSHGERIAAALDLDPASFTTMPHGTISEIARRSAPERAPGVLRVGHFGALYATKGVHVLLEAVKRARRRDAIEVHLYGTAVDESYGAFLRELAQGSKVEFHGAFTPADLATAPIDAVVLPSLAAESFSFALDDALALGVPIVASDFGALGERLGSAGRLFPRGDRDALAAILDALADAAPHEGNGSRGAAAAQPAVPFAEHAAAMEALYRAVLKEGPAPAASTFDDRAHLALEFEGREHLLRHALRYESLAHFARDLQEDRENRIKMIDFLESERERLSAELARHLAGENDPPSTASPAP